VHTIPAVSRRCRVRVLRMGAEMTFWRNVILVNSRYDLTRLGGRLNLVSSRCPFSEQHTGAGAVTQVIRDDDDDDDDDANECTSALFLSRSYRIRRHSEPPRMGIFPRDCGRMDCIIYLLRSPSTQTPSREYAVFVPSHQGWASSAARG
jgi:hypothetical protein